MVRKIFIETRLSNPVTYIFKEHIKIVKIYMMKSNVSIFLKSISKLLKYT